METSKKQNEEIVQTVDVELNEEQLDVVSGGIIDGGCVGGPVIGPIKLPPIFLPPAPPTDDDVM